MIHFAIGTKAQFIKMAPIMHLLQSAGVPYHLLDLSQHGSLTGKILDDFRLSPNITRLSEARKSVTTYTQAARWLAHGLWLLLVLHRSLRQRLFLGCYGVALLHGDTLSTLLGLYLARAAGLKTALVEAGLSSGNLFEPFPEEWIRTHVGKRVDYLFPPDEESEARLRERGYPGQIVNSSYNTGKDALSLILRKISHDSLSSEPYGLATLHRFETISSTRQLRRVVMHVIDLSRRLGTIRFYMHPPTENALRRTELIEILRRADYVKIYPLAPYPEFIATLAGARFVLTDGGSIQEEASYLKKPCLILRNRTERRDGFGSNADLATWNIDSDFSFLTSKINELPPKITTKKPILHASQTILRSLDKYRLCQESR